MTAFLAANLSTILICIVLIAIVVSISIYLVRRKKAGKGVLLAARAAHTVPCTVSATAAAVRKREMQFSPLCISHISTLEVNYV